MYVAGWFLVLRSTCAQRTHSFDVRVVPPRAISRARLSGTWTTKLQLNRATVTQQLYERLANECRSASDSYNTMIGRRADSVAVTDSITAPTAWYFAPSIERSEIGWTELWSPTVGGLEIELNLAMRINNGNDVYRSSRFYSAYFYSFRPLQFFRLSIK